MDSQSAAAHRKIVLLSKESKFVDWLELYSFLPSDYWRDWHPLLFVQINVETEWPRWNHHLHEAMNDRGTLISLQARGEYVLLVPQDNLRFSRMLQMSGWWTTEGERTPGMILFSDGNPTQDAVWIECCLSATSRLTEDLVEFPWKAAIGPYPSRNMGQASTRLTLTQSVAMGGMTIEPLNMCVIDRPFLHEYPSLSALPSSESWLVAVAGTALGFEERRLQASVTQDVVLVCAVFSLASGVPWVVRSLPFAYGDNEIHMADEFYGPTHLDRVEGPLEFKLPDWADGAFRFARENEDFRNALLMYSESLQIEGPHPSIVLVAYMSCLQTLGKLVEDHEKLRIRAILRKVRDETEVTKIRRHLEYRDKTAHESVLWGSETAAHSGGIEINPFVRTGPQFWSTVWQVRNALADAFVWLVANRNELLME